MYYGTVVHASVLLTQLFQSTGCASVSEFQRVESQSVCAVGPSYRVSTQ